MANEQPTLTDVAKDTGELIHQAGAKTTQTVLAHTEKYQDAYQIVNHLPLLDKHEHFELYLLSKSDA